MSLCTDRISLGHSLRKGYICQIEKCANPRYFLEHPERADQLSKEDLLELSPWQLQMIWDNLSSKLKEDKDLLVRLPCYKHYNRPEDIVHIDGPPPAKYKCWGCKLGRI